MTKRKAVVTMIPQTKAEAAVQYAKKGFYVLPMFGKTPAIKFAHRQPLSLDQVKEYWQKNPNYNIGLRTVQFFVVDVDTKQAHSQDGLQSMHKLPHDALTETLVQRTASGGLQFLYKQPKKRIGQDIAFRPGIDIKGHQNNYVIVAPSTTSKGRYQWINAPMLINAPSDKLIQLIRNDLEERDKDILRPTSFNKTFVGKTYTGNLLDEIIDGADQGHRNDFLIHLAGKLFRTGASSKTIYNMLLIAAENCSPALPEKEVNTVFESMLRMNMR